MTIWSPWRDQSRNDKVQRVGNVVAEHQSVGGILIAAEKPRQPLASSIEQRACFHGQVVATAAGIYALGPIELVHEL